MVSSGGGGTPKQPSGQQSFLPPPGLSSQPYDAKFTSFLPSDGSMATGLTPEMNTSIMSTPPPPPQPMSAGPTGPSSIGGVADLIKKAFSGGPGNYRASPQMSNPVLAERARQQAMPQDADSVALRSALAMAMRGNGGGYQPVTRYSEGGRGASSGQGGSARGGAGGFGGSSARGGRAY